MPGCSTTEVPPEIVEAWAIRSAVPETRRRFDAEFRQEAVRIVRETRKPIAGWLVILGCVSRPWVTG